MKIKHKINVIKKYRVRSWRFNWTLTSLGSSQQSVLDKKYFVIAVYVSFVNEIPGISSDKKVTKISLFEILYSIGNILKK